MVTVDDEQVSKSFKFIQIEHIVNAGCNDCTTCPRVHNESKMEEFVEHLSLVPDGKSFQTFSPQSASIRRMLKECIAKCVVWT